MKWKKRQYGESRIVRSFAWFPREMIDNQVIWLERYWRQQVWSPVGKTLYGQMGVQTVPGWLTLREWQGDHGKINDDIQALYDGILDTVKENQKATCTPIWEVKKK
tara:strand:+ start:1123 stop:1440 length:318 start_codon:yes stop_codon:yes gene_type:complete